jgi:hypothetical protein
MTTEKALEILKQHNRWRRGAEIQMCTPKEIREAIDKAIEVLQKSVINKEKQS